MTKPSLPGPADIPEWATLFGIALFVGCAVVGVALLRAASAWESIIAVPLVDTDDPDEYDPDRRPLVPTQLDHEYFALLDREATR